MELRSAQGRWPNPVSSAWAILKKYWPGNLTESVKGMRQKKDNTGVVFDIYENQVDRFQEIFNHLKETDSRIDFIVEKCNELPELDDESGSGFESRGGSSWNREGGSGGYQRHGRQNSFGGYSGGGGGGYSQNKTYHR